jgi:hypothetical protein
MRAGVLAAVILLAATTFATFVFSQATDANLVGTVLDSSGAAVPNANLELENLATGVKFTATSDSTGSYRFSNFLAGAYKITAGASGFKSTILSKVDLLPGRTSTMNLTLEVGATSTTVEVSEAGVVIDTTSAQVTNSFEALEAIALPAASNSTGGVLNLSLLGAGVGSSGGTGLGSGPSVGGQRVTNNSFTIEGVDNNDQGTSSVLIIVPNDFVSNFTILQNQFSAEFGHAGAGQFMTNVKGGTNQIHGVVYDYMQNRKLNALDQATLRNCTPDQVDAGTCKPRYDNNRFGAGAGGPIIKDKLFWYGAFEYQPIGQAAVPGSPVYAPTAAGYTALKGISGLSANNLAMFEKYVGAAPSASDSISVGERSIPVGILPIIAPNYSNNLTTVGSIDYNPSSSDQIRGRWIYVKNDTMDINATLPVFFISLPYRYHVVTVSEFHNFRPNLINEFRVGYNRYANDWAVPDLQFTGLAMFPNITIDELNYLNVGPDPNAPQSGNQNTYQLIDNVSWIKGPHQFKFGGEYRRVIYPQSFTQRVRGDYEWSYLEDYLRDFSPDQFGQRSTGNNYYWGNNHQISWFVNDNWAIKKNLTLNLGLRYEFMTVPDGEKVQSMNAIASVPGLITFGEPQSQKGNFAPRVGIAYSPGTSGNTSIRAGFGMSYDILRDNIGLLSLPPQLSTTNDVDYDNPTTRFLATGGLPMTGGGTLTAAQARAATASYIPDQVRPTTVNWNLAIQHVFKKDYTLEVRYVGNHAYHLDVQSRMNINARVTESRSLPTYFAQPTQAQLNALPLTLSQLTSVSQNSWRSAGFTGNVVGFMPIGNSVYHGMALQLNRRFSNGLMFIGAYTWSHSMDDSTADVYSTVLTPRRGQDFQNTKADWSSSALDRRQRFSFSAVYELPFGKNNTSKAMKALIGGWQVSGTYIAESPEYATVQSGLDSNLNGDNASDRVIENPNGVKGTGSGVRALTNGSGETVAYLALNPNAQYIVAGAGAWANVGRNTLPMRGINNVDFSLSKTIKISEKQSFLFSANMFNFFNHPQYTPGTVNNVNFTSDISTRSFLVPSNSNFADWASSYASNARSITLALKFTF